MKRILVVDDNIVNLKQAKVQLGDSYEVMLASSGNMALKILEYRRPDLFLLDIEMPGMNGFEFFIKFRENPGFLGIPVIFYSSRTDIATQHYCFKLGAQDYIIKPTAQNVLLYRINLHLQLADYLNKMEETAAALSEIMTESFAELINFRYKMSGHSTRVPKLCSLLGEEFLKQNNSAGINLNDLKTIVQASPLHDIGNITIPDKILLKPGSLSEEERNIMKNHCIEGALILGHFSLRIPTQRYYQYARLIALTHHEAWNGGGYPSGLKGNDIPFCGRLVALADVYDDLTSDRVYRKGFSHEEASRTIINEKGKRFDPEITEAFETVKDKFEEICTF